MLASSRPEGAAAEEAVAGAVVVVESTSGAPNPGVTTIRPPGSGRRPPWPLQDQVYFTAVSDAYKRITGIENVPMHRTPEGAFFQYGYFQFGVPSFSTLGWGFPADTTRGRSDPPRRPAEAREPIRESYRPWMRPTSMPFRIGPPSSIPNLATWRSEDSCPT